MRKTKYTLAAILMSAAMALPVCAEPETKKPAETQTEETTKAQNTETKPAADSKEGKESDKTENKTETTAASSNETPAAPEEPQTEEPAETEESTAEEAESTEPAVNPTEDKTSITDSTVRIMTGYRFEDGSIDIWLSGGGLCVKDDIVVAPVISSYFLSEQDKTYQELIAAKKSLYEAYKIDISSFDSVRNQLSVYVCPVNGAVLNGTVIYTDNSIAVIRTDKKLDAAVYEIQPADVEKTGILIGLTDSDIKAVNEAVASGTAVPAVEPGMADVELDTNSKTLITEIENDLQGGILTNQEGLVTGIISRADNKYEVLPVADIKTAVNRAENKDKEDRAGRVSDTEVIEKVKALETAVKEAKTLTLNEYTEATATVMQNAINGAEAVLKKLVPGTDELEKAVRALEEGKAGLVKDENARKDQPEATINSGKLTLLIVGFIAIMGAIVFAVWFVCFKKPKNKDEDDDETEDEDQPLAKLKKTEKFTKQTRKKKDKEELDYGQLEAGYGGEYARKMEEGQNNPDTTEPDREVLDRRQFPDPESNDDTTVLKRETKAYLMDTAGERLEISKKESLLGRQKSVVDIHIKSDTVGRRHCVIRMENGRYTVEDLDSLNKTKVNGKTLEPHKPVPLSNGDKLVLSDSEFIFYTGE